MTDAEARELIENNIRLIRDSYHWGQVIVEVRNGKIYRVNLTVSTTPCLFQISIEIFKEVHCY